MVENGGAARFLEPFDRVHQSFLEGNRVPVRFVDSLWESYARSYNFRLHKELVVS